MVDINHKSFPEFFPLFTQATISFKRRNALHCYAQQLKIFQNYFSSITICKKRKLIKFNMQGKARILLCGTELQQFYNVTVTKSNAIKSSQKTALISVDLCFRQNMEMQRENLNLKRPETCKGRCTHAITDVVFPHKRTFQE